MKHDLFGKPVSTFPDHALVDDDAADALAVVHQIEGLVDVGKRHRVSDHRIDLDFSVHVPVHDSGHIAAAFRAENKDMRRSFVAASLLRL